MAYPRSFLRVVFSGTTMDGKDIWSCSFAMDAQNFTQGEAVPDSTLQGLQSAWSAFHRSAGAAIHQSCEFRTTKANMVGTDGLYSSSTSTRFIDYLPGQIQGNVVQSAMTPPQIALAVSLLTGAQRGLASRGRFYPPATQIGVTRTGLISDAERAAMTTDATALVDAMNAVDPARLRLSVASDVREGAIRPVTRVAVGNVHDTIRSRRSALVETYSEQAVAT